MKSSKSAKIVLFASALFLFSCQSFSKNTPLEDAFNIIHQTEGFSGGILVVQEGRVQLRRSYGRWGMNREKPLAIEDRFRIASITKPFTAMAVLQLVEQGHLALDEPVGQYLPDLPWGSRVTIRQLLNHTGGISRDTVNQVEPLTDGRSNYLPPLAMLDLIRDDPLDFPPGERYMYSNNSFQLLGMVIEALSGMPYEEYITTQILEPKGLEESGFDYYFEDEAPVINGYLANGQAIPPNDKWYYGYAALGMSSTLDELFKWMKDFFEGRILDPLIVAEMTSPQVDTGSVNPLEAAYGYGWHIGTQKYPGGTTPVIHHSGDVPGFSSIAQYYPELDLYILAYSNDNANLGLFGYPGTVLYYLY
jgi:D-alanyl-D-alanine carboxypeptidase